MVLYRGTSKGFLCDNTSKRFLCENPLEGATFFSRPHSDNTLSSKIDWWFMTDSPILPSVWILSRLGLGLGLELGIWFALRCYTL